MKCVAVLLKLLFSLTLIIVVANGKSIDKDEVDKVIEDEITHKLSEDLLQSIEKKFHVDLERSVDSVLQKIKLLLQNGTVHIQEKLAELQAMMDAMKNESSTEVDSCLIANQNVTTALAEKALHQMVVCGYALIGHDPAQAVRNVMELKSMIRHGLKPIYKQRAEIYDLLKICGHDHDSLKKVIKCVIAKSPQLKSAMMGVSSKLIEGVVQLTKQMAHGAMHEACLIEVIKTIEEEAFNLMGQVRLCSLKKDTVQQVVQKYIKENNATELDVPNKNDSKVDVTVSDIASESKITDKKEATMHLLLKNALKQSKAQESIGQKLKIQKDMKAVDNNVIGNDKKNVD